MKKLSLLVAVFMLFVVAGCSQNIQGNPQLNTWDNIQVNTWKTNEIGTIQYSWELIVAGIGPDETFESTVAKDTLVLKRTFDDHSDHLFFPRQIWSNYLDSQKDMLPWNHIKFVGTVKPLDAAAGNHYYEVVTVDKLVTVWTPKKDEVEKLIQRYAYCEKDTDCVGIYGKCPLWCHIAINTKYQSIVEKIIDNFWNNQDPQCTYKCMEIGKVVCTTNHMCEAK